MSKIIYEERKKELLAANANKCDELAKEIRNYCGSNGYSKTEIVKRIKPSIPQITFKDLENSVIINLAKSVFDAIKTQNYDTDMISCIIPKIIREYPDILGIKHDKDTIIEVAFQYKLYAFTRECIKIAEDKNVQLNFNWDIKIIECLVNKSIEGRFIREHKDDYNGLLKLYALQADQVKLKEMAQIYQKAISKVLKLTVKRPEAIANKLTQLLDSMEILSLTWSDVDGIDIIGSIMKFTKCCMDKCSKPLSVLITQFNLADTISSKCYDTLLKALEGYIQSKTHNKTPIDNLLGVIEGLSLTDKVSEHIDSSIADTLQRMVSKGVSNSHFEVLSMLLNKLPNLRVVKTTDKQILLDVVHEYELKFASQTDYQNIVKALECRLSPTLYDITKELLRGENLAHIKHRLETEESNDSKRLKTDNNNLALVNDGKCEEVGVKDDASLLLGLSGVE